MPAPARHEGTAVRAPASCDGRPPPRWRGSVRRAWRANRARLAAWALVLLACALLLPRHREAFQAAPAVLANLFASWQFAATLLPGCEPLISRYTRFDYGHLPPDLGAYTRSLTILWAAVLAGFAAAQAAALSGRFWSASSVLAIEVATCCALFLGEHAIRGALFPHHGPITLRRTFRAVRLAHAARDAAAR